MSPAGPGPSSRTGNARLNVPTLAMLPKIADSLSFLYVDLFRIVQDDTGVCAQMQTKSGIDTVYLPTAALSCLLLGPGTSVTARALSTLARHGTTVVCVGSGAVRAYGAILPDSLTTDWLHRQARAWADPDERLNVATRMYERRFGQAPLGSDLARLRGLEGQRVKALYRLLAQQHKVPRFKRSYDPYDWDIQSPVNLALSAANTCLYGVVHSALLAMGCSPGLGFVHTGTQHAFVYDIADLYKAETTIPLAFSLHASPDPERDARRKLRDGFRLFRLMPRIVGDIQALLDPDRSADRDDEPRDLDIVHLWDPRRGTVPAGVNYADDPGW